MCLLFPIFQTKKEKNKTCDETTPRETILSNIKEKKGKEKEKVFLKSLRLKKERVSLQQSEMA